MSPLQLFNKQGRYKDRRQITTKCLLSRRNAISIAAINDFFDADLRVPHPVSSGFFEDTEPALSLSKGWVEQDRAKREQI